MHPRVSQPTLFNWGKLNVSETMSSLTTHWFSHERFISCNNELLSLPGASLNTASLWKDNIGPRRDYNSTNVNTSFISAYPMYSHVISIFMYHVFIMWFVYPESYLLFFKYSRLCLIADNKYIPSKLKLLL